MKPMRYALAVTTMLLATTLRGQVMQQVPADALAVRKIASIKKLAELNATSQELTKLTGAMNMPIPAPEFDDPLGVMQAVAEFKGLNTSSEAVCVDIDVDSGGAGKETTQLVLLPVTDYAAFLGNFPNAKTATGVSEIEISKTLYMANWDKCAAISPSKALVSKKPEATLKAPPAIAKDVAARDAVVYANFNTLRGKLQPALAQQKEGILFFVGGMLQMNPKLDKFRPVANAAINQGIGVADRFLADAQAATFAMKVTPEGTHYSLMVEFTPDSYIANLVTTWKNTDAPLLEGLPEGKYLLYGGLVTEPQTNLKMFSDIADPIVKEAVAVGPEMKPVEDYVAALKTLTTALRGQTFGMQAPTGELGAVPLIQVIVVQNGDAKAMLEATNKFSDAEQALKKAFDFPGINVTQTTRTPNAKNIADVTLDTITTTVDLNAQNPMAMQAAQQMMIMYGPEGQSVSYGVVGDKMLTVSGVKDEVVANVIATIKNKQSPLAGAEHLKAVAGQMPKQRLGVLYVSLGDIVNTVGKFFPGAIEGISLPMPENLAPVGISFASEGTAVNINFFLPKALVQSFTAAQKQAEQAMPAAQ